MESILQETGTCGCYQSFHLFFTQMPRFLASWTMMFMMFGAFNPGWKCGNGGTTDVYFSNHSSINITHNTTIADGGFLFGADNNSRHEVDRWDLYNGTCYVIDQCESDNIEFNPSSSTIITEFGLVCDRAPLFRAILLGQSTGTLLLPLLAGQVGDKFGRKFSLYGCTAVLCIFSGFAIFSQHWIMFAICYFFIGGAVNSILGISPVFSMEVLTSKWRGYYNSLPTANVAMFLFTVVSSVLKDWIHLHIITCIMAFASCIGFMVVPESPRWLVINGKIQKAEESIQTIARFNRRGIIKKSTLRKFKETVQQQSSTEVSSPLLHFLRNRQQAITTIKFCILFLLLSVTYGSTTYGLSSLPGDYYTNAIIATGIEIFLVMTSGPLCNIIGRRLSGLLFGAIGFISCFSVVIAMSSFDGGISRNWIVNIFAYFAKSSSQTMFCIGTVLNTEVFPTVVRGAISGLLRCSTGIGALIMPFLLPSKDDNSLTVFFIIMCSCYLIICIIFPSFTETNKRNLTDGLGPEASWKSDDFEADILERKKDGEKEYCAADADDDDDDNDGDDINNEAREQNTLIVANDEGDDTSNMDSCRPSSKSIMGHSDVQSDRGNFSNGPINQSV